MKRFLSLLAMTLLCLAQPALAQTVNTPAPTYMNSSGTNRLAAQGVVCLNPTTALFESCAGAGGGAFTGLTDAQLRAAGVPVVGTFWQATQPVSGPLTDTQLRATAVPISSAAITTISTGIAAPASTTAAQNGQLAMCGAVTSAPTRTNALSYPVVCDTNGSLRVVTATGSITTATLGAGSAGIGSLTAGTATIGFLGSASWFTETTVAIGASATFTGTSRDAGATATSVPFTSFGCRANVNQVGTLVIEDSVDNTAWFRAASAVTTTDPLVAVELQINLRSRYHRCNFINGSTATTVQRIVSSYRD